MTESHTQGPWSPCFNGNPDAPHDVFSGDGQPVATALAYGHSKANAYLIAAAPDMLAALQNVAKCSEEYGIPPYDCPMMVIIRAAITKATGATHEA